MEPEDLNRTDEAWLESLLEQGLSPAPLADDGFAARVVARLEPPARRRWDWAGLLGGCGVAFGVGIATVACLAGVDWKVVGGGFERVVVAVNLGLKDPWAGIAVAVAVLASTERVWVGSVRE